MATYAPFFAHLQRVKFYPSSQARNTTSRFSLQASETYLCSLNTAVWWSATCNLSFSLLQCVYKVVPIVARLNVTEDVLLGRGETLCCVKCRNTPSKCSLSSQCCLKSSEVVNYGLDVTKVIAPGLLRYVHICTQNTRFCPKKTKRRHFKWRSEDFESGSILSSEPIPSGGQNISKISSSLHVSAFENCIKNAGMELCVFRSMICNALMDILYNAVVTESVIKSHFDSMFTILLSLHVTSQSRFLWSHGSWNYRANITPFRYIKWSCLIN